jgi:uncharacterized repeat protein (TIGR03803 family)
MTMGKRTRKFIATAGLSLTCLLVPAIAADAQTFGVLHTFSVLHTFTGGSDGANPLAGLTVDKSGNLYGTAEYGGAGYGTAFELKRAASGWTFDLLYTFASGSDGAAPVARLMPGPQGRLYGTTSQGGGGGGTVFDLGASPKRESGKERSLYRFANSSFGSEPSSGDLTFDAAGNVYGTTSSGGASGNGTVFELTRSGRGWNETVLHSFAGGSSGDGTDPVAGVIFDAAGNLYGTTSAGGSFGYGTVFELTPSRSGWSETILHSFAEQGDGAVPYAGLTFDRWGDLYGAATDGGTSGGGTIFELTPSSGGWAFNALYSVPGWGISGPFRKPVIDGSGTIFGTTHCDGAYSEGSVFELRRSGSTWTYTALHNFTGGADGGFVFSNPVFDTRGDIFGTTQVGGTGYGVVWEISP